MGNGDCIDLTVELFKTGALALGADVSPDDIAVVMVRAHPRRARASDLLLQKFPRWFPADGSSRKCLRQWGFLLGGVCVCLMELTGGSPVIVRG